MTPTATPTPVEVGAPTFRSILGAFRILGKRAETEAKPGFLLWTRTGVTAVIAIAANVSSWAYANQCDEGDIADEVLAIVSDGKVDRREIERLRTLSRRIRRCSERSRQISDAAKL